MNYLLSVIKRGIGFVEDGKLLDCVSHVFDMVDVYINYGNSNYLLKQKRMLRNCLKYAQKNCTYYQQVINNKDGLVLENYPLLTKKIILENKEKIASKSKNKMIYNLAHTGGSTGEPLEFYNANGLDNYFWIKLWKRNGYEKGDVILSMMGVKLSEELINNHVYWKITPENSLSYGKYQLSSLYLNKNNIKHYYDFLCLIKPAFIRGYPAFIYEISKYVLENKLEFPFSCKAIALTSENSYKYQWEIIEKAFNGKVILQYGHTECCVFAYSENNNSKLRVEPLYGYVEILDDSLNKVKIGEIGKVVVTSLHNNVMPLIRYDTGDLAIYGGQDERGLILNKIIGRTQDYIINKKNEKVLLTALVFAQHFNAMGKIIKWQIEQFEKGKIIIHIVKAVNYTKGDENELINLFNKYGDCDCIFDYVNDIEKSPRGKSQMIKQHLKIE